MHGIRFRTVELSKYRDQARVKAIRAAKEKAVMLFKNWAKISGGPPISKSNRTIGRRPTAVYGGAQGGTERKRKT